MWLVVNSEFPWAGKLGMVGESRLKSWDCVAKPSQQPLFIVGRQLVLPNVHENRDSGFCDHKIRPPEEMYVAPSV